MFFGGGSRFRRSAGGVKVSVNPFVFLLRDWWSIWAVDRVGVETGRHSVSELRDLLDRGEIGPKTWLRHAWTRKFALAGEVLYCHQLATAEEFEAWFPMSRFLPAPRRAA